MLVKKRRGEEEGRRGTSQATTVDDSGENNNNGTVRRKQKQPALIGQCCVVTECVCAREREERKSQCVFPSMILHVLANFPFLFARFYIKIRVVV